MKKVLRVLVVLYCCWISSCEPGILQPAFQSSKEEADLSDVVRVVYMTQTGSILPELQWSEEISITTTRATLVREGKVPVSHINTGNWEILADSSAVKALFDQLKSVDCTSVKKIEPTESPDGGDTESYTIHYQNGDQCSLYYDPGTKYENGDLIRKPISDFIQSLRFPLDSESRYVER